MELSIRPYHPSDLISLYRICLLTGDSGKDARPLYRDPDLLGHYYAAPYAVFDPALCFILTRSGVPSGYILGTRDSIQFYRWCEEKWFPVLRQQYPLPEKNDRSAGARIIRLFYKKNVLPRELAPYPAHLHIDLLPRVQKQGMGRRLIQVFLDKLAELKVPAVHLVVGRRNTGAVKFYQRIGFVEILQDEGSIAFGKTL